MQFEEEETQVSLIAVWITFWVVLLLADAVREAAPPIHRQAPPILASPVRAELPGHHC